MIPVGVGHAGLEGYWPVSSRHCSPSSLSIVLLPLGINPLLLDKQCLVLPDPILAPMEMSH